MASIMQRIGCLLVGLFLIIVGSQSKPDAKKNSNQDTKVKKLVEWSSSNSIIPMNDHKFQQYVRNTPRNYSVIVMLTVLQPHRQCSACQTAKKEMQLVADSWRYSEQFTHKLFFTMVDFDEGGSGVFQSLHLQTAPVFMHFPPKGKPKREDTMNLNRLGFDADEIAKWVETRTEIKINVYRPVNYKAYVTPAIVVCLLAGLLYWKCNSLDFFYNKFCWGLLALLMIITMISGFMWNHIRKPPYAQPDHRSGKTHYIHNSSQGQFIAETYIVMILYFAVVVSFIVLNEAGSIKSKRAIVALAGVTGVIIFFNLLLGVFSFKYHGYPYNYLFDVSKYL